MLATSTPRPGDRHERAEPKIDELETKARVRGILNRRPAVGLAVGVVRNGSLEFFQGHGVADITSNTPITEDTVFRMGSVTKTVTAVAVMQLWEQGRVDLDAPANDHLRAYRLIPAKAGLRPATLRHLLTHTAGIPEVVYVADLLHPGWGPFGARPAAFSVNVGESLPSLAEYYRGGLRTVVEPGTTFAYTNHGFATLGQIVEDVSGVPLERYLREHIFQPLGMTDTELVRSERVQTRLATGYVLGPRGAEAVSDREWVGAGGGGMHSTARDMARFVAALVAGGANEHGSVLEPATLRTMFEPHYQPDPRLPGVGLGLFRADLGGHLALEHQGVLPGFDSQIFFAPDDGVGVVGVTNGSRGAYAWLPIELGRLLRDLLRVPDDVVRNDLPHHPEIWGDLCGRYHLPSRISDPRGRLMMGAGAQIFVRGGRLMLRLLTPVPALYRGVPLHPDDENDPYVFRIDLAEFGMATARIVFSREAGLGTTALHSDLGVLSLHRQQATKATSVTTTAIAARLVGTTAIALRRRRRRYEGVQI